MTGPTAWNVANMPMRTALTRDRFAMGTAMAINVMLPVRMPEPPTPATARAPMNMAEERARPARREPRK